MLGKEQGSSKPTKKGQICQSKTFQAEIKLQKESM